MQVERNVKQRTSYHYARRLHGLTSWPFLRRTRMPIKRELLNFIKLPKGERVKNDRYLDKIDITSA